MVLPSYRLEIPRLGTGRINTGSWGWNTGSVNTGSWGWNTGSVNTGSWGWRNTGFGNSIANGIAGAAGSPFSVFSTPSSSSSSSSNTNKTETYEEYKAREAKEKEEEILKLKEEEAKAEQKEMETPLTESETEVLREETLKQDTSANKKAIGSLGSYMLFPAIFSVPLIKKALQTKAAKPTVEMFYKDGAAHMTMFKDNPEVMTQAQDTMQKLEQKFLKDIRAAKGNQVLIDKVTQERDFFRGIMQQGLDSGSVDEVAKVTAQCQTAAGVKNGWFRRLFRKQDKVLSRFDAFDKADLAKKFEGVKAPADGKSFFKNMFSSKLSTAMAVGMFAMPIAMDWGNIKRARAVDKENRERGIKTHHGRKQIAQTSIKATASFVCYNVVDTAIRTGAKKLLGGVVAKLAAKIAIKGGCTALFGSIGSAVPLVGTVVGMAVGAALDFVLKKFVFGKMKFFNNTGAKEAEVEKASGEELLSSVSEQYMMGEDVDAGTLNIMRRKCGKEAFAELRRVHDMPANERNEYIAQLQQQQQQQQAAIQQQAAQQQQQIAQQQQQIADA